MFLLIEFSPNSARWVGGWGGRCQTFFFFPDQQTTSERDWPPCKVVFFGLATNALNVRNINNNNIISRCQKSSPWSRGGRKTPSGRE